MRKVLTIVIVLSIFSLLLYYLIGNRDSGNGLSKDISVSPTSTSGKVPTAAVTDQPKTDVPDDWQKYESDELEISLNYPPDMEVSENPDGTLRFLLTGPSQTVGTEVYDGILLTFSEGNYEDDSLKAFVQNEISRKKNDDIYQSVTEMEEVSVSGKEGYKYSETSLGEFTNIYLPRSGKSYLYISYLLEDPKEQGFEEILQTILQSLELK